MRYSETENPYIIGKFNTGDTCTITIYNLSNNSIVINASPMSEIETSGYFKYHFSPSPISFTEYLCIMTNSIDEEYYKIELGGYVDKILGLVHHNIYIDEPEYDEYDNMVSSRLRIYSNPDSVGSSANVISSYRVTSLGIENGKFSMWKQVELVDSDYLEFEDDSGVLMLEDGDLLELG